MNKLLLGLVLGLTLGCGDSDEPGATGGTGGSPAGGASGTGTGGTGAAAGTGATAGSGGTAASAGVGGAVDSGLPDSGDASNPDCGDALCGFSESCSSCALDCGTCPGSSSNLIFDETFEGSTVWAGVHKQFGTPYAFNVVSSPAFEGEKSGRFELREGDPVTSGGTRSEVLFPEQSNAERWYAFSVFFPSGEYAFDSFTEIITQWHQGGGTSPPIALELKADRYEVVIPAAAAGKPSTERTDIGGVTKDAWNRFVFHIKHSSAADGLLEIWLNQTKLMTRTGSNMYSSSTATPRWKLGIYKWKWNSGGTTDTDKRVLFYDSVRMANEKASLAEL
jgi:hypothetical protein